MLECEIRRMWQKSFMIRIFGPSNQNGPGPNFFDDFAFWHMGSSIFIDLNRLVLRIFSIKLIIYNSPFASLLVSFSSFETKMKMKKKVRRARADWLLARDPHFIQILIISIGFFEDWIKWGLDKMRIWIKWGSPILIQASFYNNTCMKKMRTDFHIDKITN